MSTATEDDIADKCQFAALNSELATLKHMMMGRGRIPSAEYERLSARRAELVGRCNVISSRLAQRRAERMQVASEQQRRDIDAKANSTLAADRHSDLIRRISSVRDHYQRMAQDRLRPDGVRFMANQFQEALAKALGGT